MISFIIPVRDDAAHLERCLASIATSAEGIDHEVIVIDNGSRDDSAGVARRAGARTFELPRRRVAELRNAGAALAAGDVLAFIDADHEIAPGWAAAGLALLEDAATSGVGAQYHAPVEGTWVQRTYDRLRNHQPGSRPVGWLPSGNLMVRRAVFERIKGFDETLETCEDVDLCQRLRQDGGTLIASDAMSSVHRGDPRTLKALFVGELWRGRDNLRVSLRGPLSWSDAPSLVLPLLYLTALVGIVVGMLSWPLGGGVVAAASIATIVLLTLVRTAALLRAPRDRSPGVAFQSMLVGTVYDTARALALVSLAGHGLRRKS